MKNLQISLARLAALAVLATAGPALADEARLVLTNGSVIRIQGQVERKDGLVLFRTLDGTLGSLKESAVARVVTGSDKTAREGQPGDGTPGSRSSAPAGAVLYTNEDLTPLPQQPPTPLPPLPPPTGATAPETAGEETGAGAAAPETEANDRAVDLRQQLQAAEVERNTAYRLLVCAQHEIPFESPDCKASLLPKPDNSLSAATESALRTRYLETEKRIEDLQRQLKALKPGA